MKIRSKLILSAVAATLGCALLAGCGGAASSSTASSASPTASSVVLSQAESALPDDGTNSPDALADEVDALLEANPIVIIVISPAIAKGEFLAQVTRIQFFLRQTVKVIG